MYVQLKVQQQATFHLDVLTSADVVLRLTLSTMYSADRARFLGTSIRFVVTIPLRYCHFTKYHFHSIWPHTTTIHIIYNIDIISTSTIVRFCCWHNDLQTFLHNSWFNDTYIIWHILYINTPFILFTPVPLRLPLPEHSGLMLVVLDINRIIEEFCCSGSSTKQPIAKLKSIKVRSAMYAHNDK